MIFDKFDNEESNKSFVNICSFCEREIHLSPVRCIGCTEKFCDLCCAKLFYDNVYKITIDSIEYTAQYRTNQLSSLAKHIYEITGSTLFEMMPIYKFDIEHDDLNVVKNRYLNVFIH